jgi:hypothetical protein
MILPTTLPTGKFLSARTASSAALRLDLRARQKESRGLTELLQRIAPELVVEFRALRRLPSEKGKAAPRDWVDASERFYARCLLDGAMACKQAKIPIQSIRDFGSALAIAAVVKTYTTSGGSGQNASRILRGLRTLIRLVGGSISKSTGRTIRGLSRTPRRGAGQALPSAEACRSAALEAFLQAATMIGNGKPRRGKTRMRDAVLMAVQIEANFRRGEFDAITVDLVIFSEVKAEVRIIIPESTSKVRQVQLGIIRDETVIAMLRRLKGDKTVGPLFETNWATPLASVSKYKALKRAGARTVGVPLSFNMARRIGVTSETHIGTMRRRLRHAPGSEVAEQTYAWHADDIGIDECRAKLHHYGLPTP